MPPRTYRARVEETLSRLAKSGETTVAYSVLVDRIVAAKRVIHEPVGRNYTKYIHKVVVKEAQAHRLRLRTIGDTKMVILSEDGKDFYVAWRERICVPRGHGLGEKAALRAEYLRLAAILGQIVAAFQGHASPARLWDIRGLPDLVREHTNVLEDLREQNEEAIGRLVRTRENVLFLDPTYFDD
ncbi:uncharacterized protein TRAVEDRAFT_47054 [Trametes versicolor FP-101664 SS1]|uniref:uncharacterized protein n=1 Tax=Trametes versicolor (strain FP-101664) TaxID=717944 RepID=UPI0004624977|nr:uncharacterized protein TRAVEDRAFT_47054 [Trametes versicolor FP-101664 SS1]EIW59757.1 hypothetical protein TRAVEDRAFT_47054 [Trametes versicolor FP-101664 SS1]